MRLSFLPRLREGRGRNIRRGYSHEAPDSMPFEEPLELAEGAAGVDPSQGGWSSSSLELRHGLEVSDVPLDTLPDDLISGFNKL